MAPHDLLIGAQLEPNVPDAGRSIGQARMVITCDDCPDKRWILSANVRSIRELAAMQEYHHAEHAAEPTECPTCESPAPERHPAVQFEGEVQPCPDPWHGSTERGREVLARIRFVTEPLAPVPFGELPSDAPV